MKVLLLAGLVPLGLAQFPTETPTESPIPSPTPSLAPSGGPTARPTTLSPSATPSLTPSARPSAAPSVAESVEPTSSISPTMMPTVSSAPTPSPTGTPTADFPSESPQPTPTPSMSPTDTASLVPSKGPSRLPTEREPTESPAPSPSPSILPTITLSDTPTSTPTPPPTNPPTFPPTPVPTTRSPTATPSVSPRPTESPTPQPTGKPSSSPSTSQMPSTYYQIDYFNLPRRKWSIDLDTPNFSQLSKGNAVTLSPDNALLYITANNGKLTVLNAKDGSERWSFTPSRSTNNTTVSCASGVYFGEHPVTGEEFAAYSIVDEDPEGSLLKTSSRIVAVSHPYNRVMFISPSLPGKAVGTPVVSRSVDTRGVYMFITHNAEREDDGGIEGYFTVLLTAEDGAVHYTEGAGKTVPTDTMPYGPLGVTPDPAGGKFPGGFGNNNDLMMWTTSEAEGRGVPGYLRAFQIPQNYDPPAMELATIRLTDVQWNAIAHPTISSDGLQAYVGHRASQLSGWVDVTFDSDPDLMAQLPLKSDDLFATIKSAPVLSIDKERLFSSSATNTFHGLHAKKDNGMEIWSRGLVSASRMEAKVSPDDERVYLIQSDQGLLTALNQLNGQLFYNVTCGPTCENVVEAEFALSDNGLCLYYGDVDGRIFAYELGVSLRPTIKPTDYPSFSPQPTPSPTGSPSISPGPTWIDETFPSSLPSLIPSDLPSSSFPPSSVPSSLPSQFPSLIPSRSPFDFNPVIPPESAAAKSLILPAIVSMILGLVFLQG